MADEWKKEGDVEAAEGEDSTVATVKRQRTAPEEEEKEENEEEHADGGKADVGDDILAWLTDLDEKAVHDLMINLLEPSPTPVAGKVCFADNPRSMLQSSPSYITINTANEESCGSSFSDAPSVMASFDAGGIAVGAPPVGSQGTFVGSEEKSSPSGKMLEWGNLADDDGDDVLARFLGEDLL